MLRKAIYTVMFLFCIIGLYALPLKAEETTPAGGTAKKDKGKIVLLGAKPEYAADVPAPPKLILQISEQYHRNQNKKEEEK